jgi:hypothetical protein
VNRIKLRTLIEKSLRSQGFRLRTTAILPPKQFDKDRGRQMHSVAVLHKRNAAKKARWAKRKGIGAGKSARKKGEITPAGRKRLSQLMKVRWAARKKAAGK